MEFFCYHTATGPAPGRCAELLEAHWPYMDRFQAGMIARAIVSAGRYASIEVHRWQFGGCE